MLQKLLIKKGGIFRLSKKVVVTAGCEEEAGKKKRSTPAALEMKKERRWLSQGFVKMGSDKAHGLFFSFTLRRGV